MYTVSITSQKQMSIPVKIWEELGFKPNSKANVFVENKRMVVEPVPDIMDLAGSLHKYAKKGMSIDKIIALEKKAWEKGAVERYKKTLRNSE